MMVDSKPLPHAPPPLARAYGLVYAGFFLLVGLSLPFFPVWLQSRGVTPSDVGAILATTGLVRIVVSPLMSTLADVTGRPKRVLTGLAALTLCAYLGLSMGGGFWVVFGLACLGGALHAAMLPLIDSSAVADANDHRLDYGRLRLWGSLSFIAASYGAGWALTWAPPSIFMTLAVAALAMLATAVLGLPARPRMRSVGAADFSGALRALARNRTLLLLILAGAFVQASHGTYYAFGTLNWRRLDLAPHVIGALWVTGVIAEIGLFACSNTVLRWLGPSGLVLIGAGGALLRWSVLAMEPPLFLLFPLQMLHALTFAATHIGVVQGIYRAAPAPLAATVQSLSAALSGGILTSAAIALSGLLYGGNGSAVYLLPAGMGLVAVALLAWRRAAARSDESLARS